MSILDSISAPLAGAPASSSAPSATVVPVASPATISLKDLLDTAELAGSEIPVNSWTCWHWDGQGRPPVHSQPGTFTHAAERFRAEAGNWRGLALRLDGSPILFKGADPAALIPLPPLTPAAVRARIVGRVRTPAGLPCEDRFRGTDKGNAELFLSIHGESIKFVPPWNKWLLWTGTHWQIDDGLEIGRLAADLPRHLYAIAGDTQDSAERSKIAKLAHALENTRRQLAFLEQVRLYVVAKPASLESHPFLLNCANGTIDLRTGELRPHDRADMITHCTGIDYRPGAICPAFRQFLHGIFTGDIDLIRFVQRAIGYSLTGCTKEQVLFICHGSGSNGKGKLMNTLRKILAVLAAPTPSSLLMTAKTERHPTELAILFGKRAVIAQETNDGQRFNESLVKQLTGEDAISVRRMREDFWEFNPTHKLWLATNHKPNIKGTDYAIWRRIRLIPFTVKFHDPGDGYPVKDPELEEKLMAELPGILAWAIAGCLDWQQHGLGIPEAVKVATESYRADMDVLAEFLAECCVISRNARAKAADLFGAYVAWCERTGERAETQRQFGQRLVERGFERAKGTAGARIWLGIGLLTTESGVSGVSGANSGIKMAGTSCSRGNTENCATNATYATTADLPPTKPSADPDRGRR